MSDLASRQQKHKMRQEIWHAQNGLCHYCAKAIPSSAQATFDHKKPKSRGGTSQRENLVVACSKCNSTKGARDHYEFVRALLLDVQNVLKSEAVQAYVRTA